jgi:hypothetical protein
VREGGDGGFGHGAAAELRRAGRRGRAGRVSPRRGFLGLGVHGVHARARERHRAAHERVAQRDVLLDLRGGHPARAAVHQVEERVRQPQRRGARRQRHRARLQRGARLGGVGDDGDEVVEQVARRH